MNAAGPKLTLRADLVQRQIWMGGESVWVVKDPLAREFLYFSDQEHEILKLADGGRSLAEIVSIVSTKFAPEYFSAESVMRFFADARAKGVLVANELRQTIDGDKQDRRRWWHNPLAIRLPGMHPDRVLDAVYPFCRPLFSPVALLIALLIVMTALLFGVAHFVELTDQLSIASSRLGLQKIGLVLVVISLTKIIHELSHAMVCKHFGGDCREIGIMLLIGVPCLYCDVSDVWMMPRRRQRVLVSAAGMLAEILLAAIAMFVWLATVDGELRDLCVIVISVCSLSTVLLNGNPLLRYDGYYIASDLLGIPNLASQSSQVVRNSMRRFLWGLPTSGSVDDKQGWGRRLFLVSYSLASGTYRLLLYSTILWIVYRAAADRGVGGLVGGLILLAFGSLIYKWMRTIVTPPHRSLRRASMTPRRPLLIATTFGIFALTASFIPLPRSVVAPMTIEPSQAQGVFVPVAGIVRESIRAGADVRQGDVLARLDNPVVERELLASRHECERLRVELEAIRRQRTSDPRFSARIPSLEKALGEANKRLELREAEAQRLTIRAPRDGRVYASRKVVVTVSDARHVSRWAGTPLDRENDGAWLESSTVLCAVGDATSRDAIVVVHQQDIELVQVGQQVRLLIAGWAANSITGTVTEVSVSPIETIPEQIAKAESLSDFTPADHHTTPRYQVRVKLYERDEVLPVRLVAKAQIQVQPASMLSRLARFLGGAFGLSY